jgi:hypothetical protein
MQLYEPVLFRRKIPSSYGEKSSFLHAAMFLISLNESAGSGTRAVGRNLPEDIAGEVFRFIARRIAEALQIVFE